MMRIATIILIFLFTTNQFISAQNLVENGSFETIEKKPKERGQIFLAPPWVAGTKATPDLYSESAKKDEIKVPENMYGDEKPDEGSNYAGLLFYSDREKEARTYLTTKLKYPMLAGEYYCVKFHISFADLSKYAVNNIGAYVSHDSIGSETDLILDYEPQIINSTNRIFDKQWDWEKICRIYVAEGGEQYLTIGNFAPQAEVEKKSVKRPRSYTSSQFRDGYYYIDNISILPNATPENCKCEPGNFAFANLNKEEAEFETQETDIPDQVIISTTGKVHGDAPTAKSVHEDVRIEFAKIKSNLPSSENAKLNETVDFLKKNENVKIKLIGHQDETEKVIKGLSKKRIDQVGKYLLSKGIAESRISSEDADFSKPLSDVEMNSIVEIKFLK